MTFDQLLNNDKFAAEFDRCASLAEGAKLMTAYGVPTTEEQLSSLLASMREGELTESQLDAVAGGAPVTPKFLFNRGLITLGRRRGRS